MWGLWNWETKTCSNSPSHANIFSNCVWKLSNDFIVNAIRQSPLIAHQLTHYPINQINVNVFQYEKVVNNNIKKIHISSGYHIWQECQSNIWSADTKTYMRLIITKQLKIIYTMYRACEVSVHRACCERST